MASEGGAQPLRFGPWLLQAVSSGAYRGLRWLDGARTAFRVPWKHNARKDVSSSDLQIFKDWAKASGRYQVEREDPARWKTNFRCALRSTRMFVLLEDCSKSGEDPHKVYGIAGEAQQAETRRPGPGARCSPPPLLLADVPAPGAAPRRWQSQTQLELDLQDLSLENVAPGGCGDGAAGGTGRFGPCPHAAGMSVKAERAGAEHAAPLDTLQWVMQQCDLGHQPLAWATAPGKLPRGASGAPGTSGPAPRPPSPPTAALPAGDGPCGEQALSLGPTEGTVLPALHRWATPAPADAAGLLQVQSVAGHMLLPPPPVRPPGPDTVLAELAPSDVLLYAKSPREAAAAPQDAELMLPATPRSAAPETALLQGNAGSIPPNLDVSIFYRGKLFHHEEVGSSRCLLAYQTTDPAVPLDLTWLVQFPSPASLADQKQRHFTEELLQNTGLLLEQRDNKIYAQRLKKCKVFWALSRQLDVSNLSPKLLCRNQETEIFDFKEFCTELRDFRDYRREHSPDFTIFLCFGQCFSKAKPKESMLILVKLVPKFCEYWYEQVLQEGASSLSSGSLSLQLSDSFSLFELIEQYNMQLD
ncbi:interferon regulatory factor 7 [Rhea pennata]|uniref:interferon regulatory factor 7 n=1 Tax=Rhea pennata TaxID=8795 RepID=UPI002E272629